MNHAPTVPNADYWHRALDGFAAMVADEAERGRDRETSADTPPSFKPYRSLPRHRLPRPMPAMLADARPPFAGSRARSGVAEAHATPRLDADRLATLLHYVYGVSRQELGPAARWAYHRYVPSARCLFPTELYVWLPAVRPYPPGVYYYDPAHHQLVLVRGGDLRTHIAAATLPVDAECALLLSSLFWKTAFRYGDYAYRLCTQEVGLVAGNALMVAGALGLWGRLRHQFPDDAVESLLGIDWHDEAAMMAVPLFRQADVSRTALPDGVPPGTSHAGDTRAGRTLHPGNPGNPGIAAVHERTRLGDTARFGRMAAARPPAPQTPADDDRTVSLPDALRRRQSGPSLLGLIREPISLRRMRRVLGHALDPHPSDAVLDGDPPPIDLHLAVIDVEDLPSGLYRLHPDGALECRRPEPPGVPLQRLLHEAGVGIALNCRTANFVAYLVGDLDAAARGFGGRAERILSQEAGVVAQRICVLGAAEELTARIHNGYPADRVREFLGLRRGRQAPLFQIVVGRSRPTARYQLPVVW
ncbi:MAG: SagB family peptide dehydrogenase [Spirillospora sp.]